MLAQMLFPAISISQGVVVPRIKPDFVVTEQTIKMGYFADMWIADSRGRAYHVTGCEVLREPFWRHPKIPFGRGVRIQELRGVDLGAVSLEEVRERVIAVLAADAEVGSGVDDSHDAVGFIASATTVGEIAQILSGRGATPARAK